ncbi:DMT family transporter [Acidovorax sp. SUPP2825]|uniref:DMT family transporter n=1 Tax=Acidovorax sp. SUPP2825 TaxID=2920879 RepID=UPI0023DE427B|nr:DMT family transporter [Acidovorax sp. SUPP2825]GKS97459.1 DMT family transporter [Acidovorax sp. SUPP2825]
MDHKPSATLQPSRPTEVGACAKREARGQWLMIAGGVLLGTVGVFVEEANQHPLVTVLFRCAFGALALLAWGVATGLTRELRLRGRSGWIVCATGCLMVVNWALFFAAIPRTSIAVATVVFHIQPVWIMVFGALVLREHVTAAQKAATAVALGGLVLTTGLWGGGSVAGASGSGYLTGLLMCLGGSLSYAGVTIIAKTEKVVTPFALAWWQCAVGMLVLLWVPWAHGWPSDAAAWAWLAGLGVLHTGLAYAILFTAMACLTLGRVAVLQYVYPLTAVLLDWAVYGRMLSPTQLAGVGLMALALFVIKTR